MPEWDVPPAVKAVQEGRGTGVYGVTLEGGGQGKMFPYGWPRYGPMPLRPELGGFGKCLLNVMMGGCCRHRGEDKKLIR